MAPSTPFADLYARYHQQIFVYLSRQLHQPEVAEDCTQDVFLKALKALAVGEHPGDHVMAWLYRIASNTAIDYQRHQRLITWLALDTIEPPVMPHFEARIAEREAIARAWAFLSPHEAETLRLWLSGYTYTEITEHLHTTRPSVAMRLERARRKFMDHYRQEAA